MSAGAGPIRTTSDATVPSASWLRLTACCDLRGQRTAGARSTAVERFDLVGGHRRLTGTPGRACSLALKNRTVGRFDALASASAPMLRAAV